MAASTLKKKFPVDTKESAGIVRPRTRKKCTLAVFGGCDTRREDRLVLRTSRSTFLLYSMLS
jgi:hypothetical protein